MNDNIELTWDNVIPAVMATLIFTGTVVLVLMMCFVITESLIAPNYTGDCLERGYTGYEVVHDDDEAIVYCTRLKNGTEEVYRLVLEEE